MTTLGAQVISDKPGRLRDTIKYLRSLKVFDEIVAVADVDNGDEILNSAKLADRYSTLKFEHQEQAIDEAIKLSTTDWMFRIDDDEKMGVNFKNEVHSLINNPGFDVYWFPRAWLYPDDAHYLANGPWYPDEQPRLWRKGFMKGNGGVHSHPTTFGRQTIHWNCNIFHYLLIDTTYEQRIQRCEMHSKLLGISLKDYKPNLGVYYLPEEHKNYAVILKTAEEHMSAYEDACKIDGWTNPSELKWLSEQARLHSKIIEVGSWKGRSTKALVASTSGMVYVVDHWSGPKDIMTYADGYKEVLDNGPDFVYNIFLKNMEGELDKLVITREHTDEAWKTLEKYGHDFDMVFIDADHDYPQVKYDIQNYSTLLKPGALICGHDYPGYPGVKRAVEELFPKERINTVDSVWWIK